MVEPLTQSLADPSNEHRSLSPDCVCAQWPERPTYGGWCFAGKDAQDDHDAPDVRHTNVGLSRRILAAAARPTRGSRHGGYLVLNYIST